MRRHRHAVAGADASVDQGLIDRRQQIVDRTDRARHECRGDAVRSRLYLHRWSFKRQALLAASFIA
jgi:hypothetical protein